MTLLPEYSTDNINWSSTAGGCSSTIVWTGVPSVFTYYRARIVCTGSVYSAYSNTVVYIPPATTTSTTTAVPTTTTTTTVAPTTTSTTTAAPVYKYTFQDNIISSGSLDCGNFDIGFFTISEVTITIYNDTCTTVQSAHPDYTFTLEIFGSNPSFYPNISIPNGSSTGAYNYTSQDGCANYYASAMVSSAPITSC
jgi:hypothetical protein